MSRKEQDMPRHSALERNASRSSRLIRLRKTLFPYFFPTHTANRVFSDGIQTIVRLAACERLPTRRIFVKSFFLLIRRYFMERYAEMCFLPLFLLLLSVFLPPCVFMRARNPCTLLLCLFLG